MLTVLGLIAGVAEAGTGVAAASACTGMMSRDLPAAECDAWQALYDATGGAQWLQCSEYRANPCLCQRVQCHDNRNIRKLLLHKNNLVGTIPAAIGRFPKLEVLGLMENELAGPVPPELGALSWLEMLFIGDNALEGALPPSIGDLTSLVSLYVGNNKLGGALPASLARLTDLNGLYLANNTFRGPLPAGLDWEQFEECGSHRCCTLGGEGNRFSCPLPQGALKYCNVNATDCVAAAADDGGSDEGPRDEL